MRIYYIAAEFEKDREVKVRHVGGHYIELSVFLDCFQLAAYREGPTFECQLDNRVINEGMSNMVRY